MIPKGEIILPTGFTGLFIGIPTISGEIRVATVASLAKTIGTLRGYEILYDVCFMIGDSAVERARNNITNIFMKNEQFSHMLMIDADMDWDDVEVLRLLSDNHDVVFGAGVKKKRPSYQQPEFAMTLLNQESPMCPLCGCIEVKAGGACFLMVSRVAVQKIIDAHPELMYRSDKEPGEMIAGIFNPELNQEEQMYYGEDISFFHRWRAVGGRVWLDPRIDLGHWGNARWTGDLMKLFRISDSSKGE